MEDLTMRENNIIYNLICFLITKNTKYFYEDGYKLSLKKICNVLWILHHGFASLYASNIDLEGSVEEQVKKLYIFGPAYLTGWCFGFQIGFLMLALACDVIEWTGSINTVLYERLKYWRDVTFNGLVVPLTMFVTTMFWGVYWIDRELVFPVVYDTVVPWWFNHCVHTNIFVMIAVETLLQPRRRPVDQKLETIFYAGVSFVYAAVYYSIFFIAGEWLYKVFAVMTWWQICLYQLLIWASTHTYYILQFPINRLIHGSEEVEPIADVHNSRKIIVVENSSVSYRCNNIIDGRINVNGKKEEKTVGVCESVKIASNINDDALSLKYRSQNVKA